MKRYLYLTSFYNRFTSHYLRMFNGFTFDLICSLSNMLFVLFTKVLVLLTCYRYSSYILSFLSRDDPDFFTSSFQISLLLLQPERITFNRFAADLFQQPITISPFIREARRDLKVVIHKLKAEGA